MKIDRKKLANKCGYDQTECLLLAKHLASLPDKDFLKELQRIKVWNYGKCELGLWADVLDRLDTILEDVTTKVGNWTLKVDSPGNEHIGQDVVTVLEFTSHLIEHSIYRCLYGSWSHILSLFSTSNMDILLAVLGLAYNFSKRSNYFARLDEYNRTEIHERLSAIAESWGGSEKEFDLASCCRADHIPPCAGTVTFEYTVDPSLDGPPSSLPVSHVIGEEFLNSSRSPSEVMEEMLKNHKIPPSRQMTLFSRLRTAIYYSDHEKRLKCIKARLQAISTLCYAFPYDERVIYPGLLDELVDVAQLPDGEVMSIKACALRTMTAIFNLQRANMNFNSILESTGMANFHGALPTRIRRWIQGLVDGTCDASGGSVNQQYTIALLSFLYHLATFEQNSSPNSPRNSNFRTLNSSGIIDSMLQLIGWHVPRNDYLSYVTRAVRVTDQIITSVTASRQILVTRLIERLDYEADLVINPPLDVTGGEESISLQTLPPLGVLNTQRSGLMKSILNLLKRISSEPYWQEIITGFMTSGKMTDVLRKIYSNRAFLTAPHLVLFAMEIITTYIYTFPSNLSILQEKGVTGDILSLLAQRPLPAFREFLIQFPIILRSLTLNSAGRDAVLTSGVLERYVETLVSKEYLTVMRSRRTRDPPTYSQGNFNSLGFNQNAPTGALAVQMAQNLHELVRSHSEFRIVVFNSILRGFSKILEIGRHPAKLVPNSDSSGGGSSSRIYMADSTATTGGVRMISSTGRGSTLRRRHHHHHENESMDIDVEVMHVGMDEDMEDDVLDATGVVNMSSYVDPDVEDVVDALLSGSDGNASDVDHHQPDPQPPPTTSAPTTFTSLEHTANISADTAPPATTSSPSVSDLNIESQSYILDYILNLSRFMERLHGFGPDWGNNGSMNFRSENHRLHSQEGIRVLYDILCMPGLPYEFPSSYSCAVFAQAILVLLNHMSPADVFQPLMNTLECAIERTKTECEKLISLDSLPYFTSKLLKENSGGETVFLHNLSTLSSVLCVVVYLNVHMKSSSRNTFIDIWSQQEFLYDLGHLYQEISWEAAVILSMIREGTHREPEAVETSIPPTGSLEEAASKIRAAPPVDQQVSGECNVFPRCVEGLSFFKIIAPSLNSDGPSNAHYVLCVAACFTNSVSELCSTLTSLCTSAIIADLNGLSSNSRRNTNDMLNAINSVFPLASPEPSVTESSASPLPPPTPPPVVDSKINIIARVALFIADTFLWRAPPAPACVPTRAVPRLQNALQYSAFHLTHVFFEQSHTPNNIILRAFAMVGGMKYIFESFSEFLKLAKQRDNYDEEAFAKVLEGMLADIDRLTDFPTLKADATPSHDPYFAFNVEKYSKYLFELLLEPLCLICEADFLKQLTYRSVEFLLNIFKNFVPFVFPSEEISELVADPTDFVLEELSNTAPKNSDQSSDTEELILTRPVLASLSEMGFSRNDFMRVFGTDNANALLEDVLSKRKSGSLYSPIFKASTEKRVRYLRTRLFNACFTIAKLHNSEETVQLVAEVILSTNTASRSIKELVKIVFDEFQSLPSRISDSRSSSDLEIALHLLAFFFCRCRFSCVRAFSGSGVPDLLYNVIVSVDSESTDIYPPRLYALCALLIDQYERSLTALQFRKRSIRQYAGQHTWAWFDESANLWHEHNSSEVSSADKAFHDGIFRGTIQGRKVQTVEFVPMIQMSDTQISRPVLLYPKLPRFGETVQEPSIPEEMTEYEKNVLQPDEDNQEPYQLSLIQRQTICRSIVNAFRRGKLDVTCSDNFLRLLLRFAATSFDDAETLLKSDVLQVLFNFTPAENWRSQYKALLGHLLRQLFYDRTSLKAKMSEVVGQFFQGSSSLMQWCCNDLFYSLAAVAPLMVRDEELALEVFKEHAELTITDESLRDGNPPKSFLLRKKSKVDEVTEVSEKLTDRQKSIISFLVDRITRSLPSTDAPSTEDVVSVDSGSVSKTSEKAAFERELSLHYLTDLATTSRAVVDALGKSKTPSRETFHSYLFNEGLRGPNSASTSNLLVTILFSSSPSTQASVIADFKASLKNVLSSYSHSTDDQSVSNNRHIIGLMHFLRTAVNLPPPTQTTVIRQFYKRQVPADLAKIISVVNCKVSNGNEALGILVKVLEVFTKIDSQIIRRGGMNDYQLSRQATPSSGTEAQVSVVSTVADAMMHTAAETTHPLASALVPTIVEAGDSVHPAPLMSTATTSHQHYQQHSQPLAQPHITEEGDTWALAEDTSEMGDTTVEDSTAILILDETGLPTLTTGTAEIGEDNTDNADEDDSYRDVDHADEEGDDEDEEEEEEDISEDHSQGSADEEGDDESDDGHDDDDDDVGGGHGVFADGHDDDDEDGDGYDDDAQVASGRADTLLHQQRVNLLDNIMGRVFEVAETAGGTSRSSQNRRHAGDERGIVLQFTTVSGGNDDFPSWSSGARQTVLPGDRFFDFVTGSTSRYDLLSHGNSFFVGEANGTSVGADTARSIHNIFRNSTLALPTRSPLIRAPGIGALRSVTGGVSDGSTTGTIHLRSLRNAPRRDVGAGSSTFLTLLPHNSRGALARLGAIVNSPILIRTNFGSSGHQPGYLSLAQPSYTRSLPPVVPGNFHDHINLPRPNRRRQNTQGSSSIVGVGGQRRSQEISEFDGDHQAYNMLMDLDDISGHAMSEASRNAVNGVVGGTNVPLNVFFSTLSAYRHFVATAAILCGQEIMDMLMLARHEVGVFAVSMRNEDFKDRLDQYRCEHPGESVGSQRARRQQQAEVPIAHHVEEEMSVTSPVVRLVDIGPRLTGRSSRIPLSELNNSDIDGETTADQESSVAEGEQLDMESGAITSVAAETDTLTETPASSERLPERELQPDPGPSTSTDQQQPIGTSTRIPVTDDEIIASMVASGVDPSFLDALPPELRRELMEDHQRSIRVHSTMLGNVPAEVDQTVLASLPPEIQEEVLDTYRNTVAAVNAASNADNDASLPSHVFSTMPDHLRREVLADLEESQLSVLTPELQAEARRLRQAQRHTHIQANVLQGGHYHGGNHNQIRAFGSTMFPAFFGPIRGTEYIVRNGRGGTHSGRGGIRALGGPNLTPTRLNALVGTSKSKALVDHEGLSCLVALVIACSSSPDIRRVTYIALKRLIENLCVHSSTRRWIISTLLNIVKSLSETPVSSPTPLTSSSASIFGAGFEAPTGCFIQNIQTLSFNGSIGIHPQASQHVCFSLLDILYDLSSAYITQFVPTNLDSHQESCDMKTDFWDIVAQLSQTDCISSSSRKSASPARTRSGGRHHPSARSNIPSEISNSEDTGVPLNPFDCYVNIVGLLRHPVVRARPVLQERVISLLVRILDEYHRSAPRTRQSDASQEAYLPSGDHVITPLSSSIIEDLCEFVVSRNSSEHTRSLATWLIVLMARVDDSTRKPFFNLLADGANSLARTIEQQLSDIINEVNKLSPGSRRRFHQPGGSGDGPSTSGPHIQHSASMTRLPDRLASPTYAMVAGGPSTSLAPPPPAPTGGELELATLQPLLSMRSEQSRLCRILRLMLYLSSCPEVSLQSLDSLSTLWRRLSNVMDCLQETNDENTVLLFQPLVECMCLAHASHTQTTVANSTRSLPLQLQRRNVVTNWTDVALPLSVNMPNVDSQSIIIFNGFSDVSQSETAVESASPHAELVGPMSPLINESAAAAPEKLKESSLTTTTNMIAWFAEKHRTGLNHILRHYVGNISESALSVFLSQPRSLDFDVKRRFFRQRFQSLRARSPQSRMDEESIVVSRNRIFEDSFGRLHAKSADIWKHKFIIRFRHEEGQDAGGLLREWYLLMSREIFNPNYALFRLSPSDRVTYTINPASFINSNHLTYFEFVGRFIAKAIYDNKLLECYFTRSFYKHILGRRIRFQDLESEDYDFYKGLEFLLNHHVSELNYEVTFCTEINEFGKNETVDLIENGRNIVVTESNKEEYVRLVCQERMTGAIRQQLDAFLKGFYSIIPKSLINIFNEQELELLISGLPSIDINDLRANTNYSKYQSTSQQIIWFWTALESFEHEDRARFLQFVTGTSRVPLGGFANLEGMHGPTKFTISRASVSSTNHLPSAHTCFNTIELPAYNSYEQLRERLLTAIRECSEGYGMA